MKTVEVGASLIHEQLEADCMDARDNPDAAMMSARMSLSVGYYQTFAAVQV